MLFVVVITATCVSPSGSSTPTLATICGQILPNADLLTMFSKCLQSWCFDEEVALFVVPCVLDCMAVLQCTVTKVSNKRMA